MCELYRQQYFGMITHNFEKVEDDDKTNPFKCAGAKEDTRETDQFTQNLDKNQKRASEVMHLSGQVLATTKELEQKREFDSVDDMYDTVDCLNRDKSKSNEKLYPVPSKTRCSSGTNYYHLCNLYFLQVMTILMLLRNMIQ